MTFESVENIVSLLCTIVGLLYGVFKYVETHKGGYRFLIGFFLANFLSEYYWTVYELVTHDDPDVSEFMTYLGWNIGFFTLLAASFFLRRNEAKRYFHPLILLPVLINIPQLVLYCTFGSIANNIWEVGVTTLTEIFCLQELLYYAKHTRKKNKRQFPLFALLALLFLVMTYGKWTSSCFDWESELLSPYIYCSVFGALISVLFPFAVGRFYASEEHREETKSTSELRFQVMLQAVTAILIVGGCVAGCIIAFVIKKNLSPDNGIFREENQIAILLFIISAVLILLTLLLIFVLGRRYRHYVDINSRMGERRRGRLTFVFTIIVTLVLMAAAVVYNSTVLYNASVVSTYEAGEEATETTATELENYLTVAVTTLRVTADSVDLMVENGNSREEVLQFLTDQTTRQFEQFDENFTGLYALIDGVYLDGTAWVPPEGYQPTERDWYRTAVAADGEVAIVSPYVDAQTGSVVVSIVKRLTEKDGIQNTVCLDVIVNHISDVTKELDVAGKGYGMVVNKDGFIIAHREDELAGKNVTDVYGQDVLDSITGSGTNRLSAELNGEDCELYVSPVMEQWCAVLVIEDEALLEDTYSQLALSILVSLITFGLISFFYYIGYKNEQTYGKKVEEMNIQVVTALAAAIDAKDNYTNGHSSRVAEYARMIAARCGYSRADQDELYMAGLLHDVGKIGIPDEVINKPGKLTPEEYERIKKHPVIGESILKRIEERPRLAAGARWHHERYDGKGYPDGLSGDNIPADARIIAVADAYDAMTSKRSYRDVLPRERVIEEIRNGMGTQFDPVFAEAMLHLIEEDTEFSMREQ